MGNKTSLCVGEATSTSQRQTHSPTLKIVGPECCPAPSRPIRGNKRFQVVCVFGNNVSTKYLLCPICWPVLRLILTLSYFQFSHYFYVGRKLLQLATPDTVIPFQDRSLSAHCNKNTVVRVRVMQHRYLDMCPHIARKMILSIARSRASPPIGFKLTPWSRS